MIATLLVMAGLAEVNAAGVKSAAEAVYRMTPNPVEVSRSQAWAKEPSPDPRGELYRLRIRPVPGPNEAVAKRLQEIYEQLRAKYGDDGLAMARDPLMREVERLSEQLLSPEQKALDAEIDRVNEKTAAYDKETLRWANAQNYAQVPSFRGRMALIMDQALTPDGPLPRIRSWTVVDWIADNRYWDSRSGRMMWTGGYNVLVYAEDENGKVLIPARRIERPGRNFTNMHLGREGWYVKFSPLRSNEAFVPLPTLSTMLRNLSLIRSPQTWASIGDGLPPLPSGFDPQETIQGYPFSGSGKAQRGAVQAKQADGGEVRIAWDFAPG